MRSWEREEVIKKGRREGGVKGRWDRGRSKSREKMMDGVHWAVVRGQASKEARAMMKEEREQERERSYSCQDDFSLPSVDPDTALFPKQLYVCVCVPSKHSK